MLEHRSYGDPGSSDRLVVVLHGGPGAPGSMAPVARELAARELAARYPVLEPFEARAGGEPLTVARHVAGLAELVEHRAPGRPVDWVGSSAGAMLALAHAVEHPEQVRSLVLVGCGTFDPVARAQFQAELAARTAGLELETGADALDPDDRLAQVGRALLPAFSVDPLGPLELARCDAVGHAETWADFLRLQREGLHPQEFATIRAPVLMLHGERDPHPGAAIHASLRPFLAQLEYHPLPDCGHYPWLERRARGPFFAALRSWLATGWPKG